MLLQEGISELKPQSAVADVHDLTVVIKGYLSFLRTTGTDPSYVSHSAVALSYLLYANLHCGAMIVCDMICGRTKLLLVRIFPNLYAENAWLVAQTGKLNVASRSMIMMVPPKTGTTLRSHRQAVAYSGRPKPGEQMA